MCETLERLVCQDDDDDNAKIQYSLRIVWLTVQEPLLEGPEVIECLADRDGFEASVGILVGYNRKQYVHRSSDIQHLSYHVLCLVIMFKHILDDTNPSQLLQQMIRSHVKSRRPTSLLITSDDSYYTCLGRIIQSR